MKYYIYIHHSSKKSKFGVAYIAFDGHGVRVACHTLTSDSKCHITLMYEVARHAVSALPQDAILHFVVADEAFSLESKSKAGKKQRSKLAEILAGRKYITEYVDESNDTIVLVKRYAYSVLRKQSCGATEIASPYFIPDYIAYTDGSCNNLSPYGEGGAAYILLDRQRNIIKQNSKGFVGVTNNKMELMAILSAVASVPDGSSLVVCTDSQYCIQVLTNKDNANNFTRPNSNVIRQYFNYASRLKAVRFEWIKGHNGNEFNEMVDALAQSRTEEMRTIHNIPIYDWRNSPKCRKR